MDGKETKMTYSPKITAALHEVMQKVGYVQKTGRNDFHKYNYAGEADLLAVLRPAMVEAGLILIPSGRACTAIDQFGNTTVEVEYTLAHKDGDVWPDKIVAFGCGNDRNKQGGVGDKGLYKALTGANKYLLFKTFQIETGDDPEVVSEAGKNGGTVQGADPRFITDDHAIIISDLIVEVGASKEAFLKYFNVGSVSELPATMYQQAVSALEKKRKKAA